MGFHGNLPYLRLSIRHAAGLGSACFILIVELGSLLLLLCDEGRLGSVPPGASDCLPRSGTKGADCLADEG